MSFNSLNFQLIENRKNTRRLFFPTLYMTYLIKYKFIFHARTQLFWHCILQTTTISYKYHNFYIVKMSHNTHDFKYQIIYQMPNTTNQPSRLLPDASSSNEAVHLQQRLRSLSTELVTLRNRLHVSQPGGGGGSTGPGASGKPDKSPGGGSGAPAVPPRTSLVHGNGGHTLTASALVHQQQHASVNSNVGGMGGNSDRVGGSSSHRMAGELLQF